MHTPNSLRKPLQRLGKWALLGCAMGLGLATGLKPERAIAAEEVIVTYRQLEFSLSLENLETFEETGRLEGDLRFYARFLDEQTLADFRRILQQRFDLDPVVVSQLTYSLLGEGVLQSLGQIVQTDARTSGFTALRAALILAANDPEGFAVVNLIEKYPSRAIRIDGRQLLTLRDQFLTLVDYRDAAVRAIRTEMDETVAQPPMDFSQAPDLSQLGPYRTTDLRLELNRDRQTIEGQPISRNFRVNLHIPEELDRPAPVIVISHGLSSTPEAFDYLGEHLASYGFATVLPQHIGSDESVRDALVSGVLGTDINPVEFIDRPLDIRYTLDVLEQMAQPGGSLEGRIDTNQVGVIGHSFGGYTALALAGAPLNTARIQAQCNPPPFTLNAAPTLQCIATRLPNFAYPLQDSRVRAAIAISPTISVVLGPESMSQIRVPTLMIGGSNDFVAAVVQEQIHPFLWMTNPDKYLALMIPSGHSSADNTELVNAGPLATVLSGPDPQQGREYIRELSLAFMQRYLQNQAEYDAYLTPDYARSITAGELDLALVRSLTPEDLQAAYGANPPIPIVPPFVEEPIVANAPSVLDAIATEGVLRVAISANALPFGFTNEQGQLQGYCVDLMEGLAIHLTEQLGTPIRAEVVAQPPVNDNFQAVRNGAAMVECGPNSIRLASEGITFSSPFFITGTHFLVRNGDQATVNPSSSLDGVRIGVNDESVTERFLEQRYPAANVVDFQGPLAQQQGVQAMLQGQVDAFAGDGILLLGEAIAQDLPSSSYRLIPDTPLSCEPYGLVLPGGDRRWQAAVNNFIASPDFRRRTERLFTPELYSYILLNLDFCAQSYNPDASS